MLQRLENSTVWKILLLLKKNGEMSIEEMSNALNITTIGVRQHILNLERNGYVTYQTRRKGVGRPGYIYTLTKKSEELFPDSYKKFILETLQDIEETDGRKKIEQIFRRRKERLFAQKSLLLKDAKNFKTKVSLFINSLKNDGYLIDLLERPHEIELIQYNCPISAVSSNYKEACRYELELYRELFGNGVERLSCASEGHRYCSYRIPIPIA